ncbi:MAG: helix-turn-helix domain-containing protein [Chloroflexota bacterium]|nr:helix-turn-helix domain-containing protein [Chloroflexota bacterium]
MSGHIFFFIIGIKLRSTPKGRAAVERETRIVRDMLALAKLREARGVTQMELARAWDVSQTNVSRVEHEEDIYLSTLRRYVAALGGRLEINAVFPDQTVTLDAPASEHADQQIA